MFNHTETLQPHGWVPLSRTQLLRVIVLIRLIIIQFPRVNCYSRWILKAVRFSKASHVSGTWNVFQFMGGQAAGQGLCVWERGGSVMYCSVDLHCIWLVSEAVME